MNKTTKIYLLIISIFIIIQFIPYGKEHENPKVVQEVNWNNKHTKQLFTKACAACHSNNTVWPWYSNIAPVSWLVSHDVAEGREHFNVSMWNIQAKNKGDEAAEELEEGEMPMAIYTLMHPEAKLTIQEKVELIKGLKETFN